jgi:Fic family protein
MTKYQRILQLWQSYHIKTASDLELRLHNFRVLFAYNSGKIENAEITYHDTREIFENGRVVGFTGDPRTIFEAENQKRCYEFLKEKIAAKEPLTVDLICEIHAILTTGTYDERRFIANGERPGEFKKHDYVTGKMEVGALPEDMPREMQDLLDEIGEYADNDTLKVAAYFHARFEYIHPFADGNGRIGRTLLNYFLMTRDHPPIIIHDEDKAAYYAALEAYDRDENLPQMHAFLVDQTEKTWVKTLERQLQKQCQEPEDFEL